MKNGMDDHYRRDGTPYVDTRREAMTQRISREEFDSVRPNTFKGRIAPETQDLLSLPYNEGVKMVCRWKHTGVNNGTCNGAILFAHVAKRYDFRVRTKCKAGTLLVLKLPRETP